MLVEIAGGSIDTAMNAEVSHRLIGRPSALVRFHALFNTGALTGAAVAALVIHAGVSWRCVWPGIAVVALAVGLWSAMTASGTPGDAGRGPVPRVAASRPPTPCAGCAATASSSSWSCSPWPR